MLFCLGNVTYLLDLTTSNPLPLEIWLIMHVGIVPKGSSARTEQA